MDLNTAANILNKQPTKMLVDIDDLIIHQLEDMRFLVMKGEYCVLIDMKDT